MSAANVQEAIQQFRQGAYSGSKLMRQLMQHDAWFLPATIGTNGPAPLVTRTPMGESWLEIFTESAALNAPSFAHVMMKLQIPRTGWLRFLTDDLAGVNIDPGTDRSIHFKRAQFPMLREWEMALDIDAILRGEDVENGFAKLRNYEGYRIIVREHAGTMTPLLAPDDGRNRKLAAVFTTQDCVDAYLAALGDPANRGLTVMRLGGARLFTELAGMPLDGIVFNCVGPVKPKAVALAFAAAILEGVDSRPA